MPIELTYEGQLPSEVPRLAGSPMKRDFRERLAAKAKTAGATEVEYICDRFANGETLKAIAEDMGCSATMLKSVVNKAPGGREAWAEANKAQADAHAENALEVTRELIQMDASKERIAGTKVHVDTLKWLAAARDPQRYGAQPQVAVQLNVGQLLLDAFKQTRPLPHAHVTPQLSAGEADVEILPDDSSEGGEG